MPSWEVYSLITIKKGGKSMTNKQALGYFMDYCNRNCCNINVEELGINQEYFQKGIQKILKMPEETFKDCFDVSQILNKLDL